MEQATHFVDLMRYLGGELDQQSIQAIAVDPDYPLAAMPQSPDGEHQVGGAPSCTCSTTLTLTPKPWTPWLVLMRRVGQASRWVSAPGELSSWQSV